MEMDVFLQNAGFTKGLRIASVVCDVNSEYRHIQVNSADFEVFLPRTLIIQIRLFHTLTADAPTGMVTAVCQSVFSSLYTTAYINSQGYQQSRKFQTLVKLFSKK